MESEEQLTDEEKLLLTKQVFDEFDVNNKGQLTKVEILRGIMSNSAVRKLLESHEVFRVLLHPSTYAESFDQFNTRTKGSVTTSEFVKFAREMAVFAAEKERTNCQIP